MILEVGIDVDVISGNDESNLGFLGVLKGANEDKDILVVDIGGGSTEFILGNFEGIKFAKSENVGALRMTEKFLTTDIVDDYEFDMMSEFIEEEIKNTIDYLKEKEINKLVEILPKLNIRDRVIMIFLATTGCLLNELVNLKWKDIIMDEKNNTYVRLGKNKKERVVKLHPYCFKLIEDYRDYSGLSEVILPTNDFVFTTQKSNSITDRNVRLIVKKALDYAGLSQYSAKDFRHSFAAISLRLGADEEDIKKQLGWSDKYYAIRYKYVLNFVDSESVDYIMNNDHLSINNK